MANLGGLRIPSIWGCQKPRNFREAFLAWSGRRGGITRRASRLLDVAPTAQPSLALQLRSWTRLSRRYCGRVRSGPAEMQLV